MLSKEKTMEWFKGKAGQVIALVGIISTLAGFGYTGATYVNRIENLEKKVGVIKETDEGLEDVVERFAALESTVKSLSSSKTQVQDMEEAITMLQTSVSAINNTIDKNLILEVREASNDVTTIAVDVSGLQSMFEALEKAIEDIKDDIDDLEDENSNPLLN